LVTTADHPLAQNSSPGLDNLEFHHQLLLEDFLNSGLKNTTVLWGYYQRVESLDLLLNLLRSGDGWALFPRHMVKDDIEQGRLLQLNIEALNVDLQLPISLWSQAQG
jgi:DNA-binding transcriptional LysR family regulator